MLRKQVQGQYGYVSKQSMYNDNKLAPRVTNYGMNKTMSLVGVGDTDNPSTPKKCGGGGGSCSLK